MHNAHTSSGQPFVHRLVHPNTTYTQSSIYFYAPPHTPKHHINPVIHLYLKQFNRCFGFAKEGTAEIFESRDFTLRKRASNSHAKPVLQHVPICDRASSVSKIDIGTQPSPYFSALGLRWDPEADILKIGGGKFMEALTRREMTSQFAVPALSQLRSLPENFTWGHPLSTSKVEGKGGFTQNAIFIRFCSFLHKPSN